MFEFIKEFRENIKPSLFSNKVVITMLIVEVALFVTIFSFYTRKDHHYYEKTVNISREDNISMEVTKRLINHGTITFNDSLNIECYMIDFPSLQFSNTIMNEVTVPFNLKKKANNDTIWVKDSNSTYFFVLKKHKEKNEHQNNPQEFRRFFKALFKLN